jgi:hypothetical protein
MTVVEDPVARAGSFPVLSNTHGNTMAGMKAGKESSFSMT